MGIQRTRTGRPAPSVAGKRVDRTGCYLLYWQREPFDHSRPRLKRASHVGLIPEISAEYARWGAGSGRYPYEARVGGLARGVAHYLLIRAEDDSPAHNQDRNTVVLTATP